MYRRIALTIALAAAVLSLSLLSSDSRARAQKQDKFAADTGVVPLGPNQKLRIIVALSETGARETTVGFRIMGYSPGMCVAGVCIDPVNLQTTPSPISLAHDESASFDIPNNLGIGVRGIVLSDRPDVRVIGCIIDTLTGATVDCSVIQSVPSA
jgi:hypothetical protein